MNDSNMKPAIIFADNTQPDTQPGMQLNAQQMQSYPSIPGYPVGGYNIINQQTMALVKMNMDIEKARELERIKTEASTERRARALDLQSKHDHRQCRVQLNYDGVPMFRNEMLREELLDKRVADISKCQAIVYEPDILKPKDTIRRIMVIGYYDNADGTEKNCVIDITQPNDRAYLEKIRSVGIKLLCGRRKQLEYAGKFVDTLESNAKKKTLPRERGFSIRYEKEGMKIDYVSEKELTWEGMIELCV